MRCEVDNSPLENSETKLSSFKPVVGLRPNSSENGRGMISKNALTFFHLLHIDIPYTLETNPNAVYVATMRSLKHPQK